MQAAEIGQGPAWDALTSIDGVGAVMGLCQERRGAFVTMTPIENRQQVVYDMPLAEIVLDFYDVLKSSTRGYASFDYEPLDNRPGDLVKLDVLLAGEGQRLVVRVR